MKEMKYCIPTPDCNRFLLDTNIKYFERIFPCTINENISEVKDITIDSG